MKKFFRIGLLIFLVTFICTVALSVNAKEKVYKLKYPCVEPVGSANTNGAEVFRNYVESASGGKIQIKVHANGELAGIEEAFELVKSGSLKIAQADETLTGFYKPLNVISIPYLFDDEKVARDFFQSDFFEQLNKEFIENTGVRILNYQPYGLRCFFNKTREVTKMEDLKGIKFRVQPVPLMLKFVKALGASPTPVAWAELYTALKTGVVDGAELPLTLMKDMKFYEVSKYYTIDNHTLGFNGYIVNEKFFQSLTKELQTVLVQGARLAGDVEYGFTSYGNRIENIKSLKAKGMKIHILSPEERERWKNASQPPSVKWLKSEIGDEYVDKAFQTVEQIKAQIK